jgi:hypothetical protein
LDSLKADDLVLVIWGRDFEDGLAQSVIERHLARRKNYFFALLTDQPENRVVSISQEFTELHLILAPTWEDTTKESSATYPREGHRWVALRGSCGVNG